MTRLSLPLVAMTFVACALATPLGGRAMSPACAAGTVHVAVIVDAGTGPVSAVCVPAGSRDNGATVLAARAAALGTPPPRYSASGLLCSIDGVPATGCGDRQNGHYAYWSYWHSSGGGWSYSSIGPAGTRVNPGVVEGWRWQPNGAALPTDPPPRGPTDPNAVCVPPPTPTTRPPTTAMPVRHGTTPPTTSAGTAQVAGAHATTITTSPIGVSRATPTAPMTSPVSGTTGGATHANTARGQATTTDSASRPSSSLALTHGGIAAGPATSSSGGAPVGLVVGVALVVAVGTGGAIATRNRRRAGS